MQISVSLVAETGTFVPDIERATKGAERAFKRLESESRKFFKDLERGPGGAASQVVEVFDQMELESKKSLEEIHKKVKITVGVIATAFALATRSVINFTSELNKAATRQGIPVEDFSKLAAAARKGGIELEGLEGILTRVSDSANESRDGISGAAAAYQALGVDVEDAAGNLKTSEQLFLDVVDAVNKFKSSPALIAAIRDIAGPAGLALISAFGGGSEAIKKAGEEAEKFGNNITPQLVQAVKELKVGLHEVEEAGKGVITRFLKEGSPALILFAEGFEHLADLAVRYVGPAIERLADVFIALSLPVVAVKNIIDQVIESFDGLGDATNRLLRLDFSGALEELKGIGKDAKGNLDDFLHAYNLLYKGIEEKPLSDVLGKSDFEYDPRALQKLEEARRKAAQEALKQAQELRRLQEAIAQGAAEIFQAEQDRETGILEANLDLRQISYKQYLTERLRLSEQAIDQEIQLSRDLIENATEDEKFLLEARISALEIRREIARNEASQDEARHVREIAQAYNEAKVAAQSYLNTITREGERTLELLSATPAERRFAVGRFQIEDRFIGDKERLDRELANGLEQEAYDAQLQVLQDALNNQLAEWSKYYAAVEEKQKDFTTSFNNAINEYVEATSNVGQVLGDTLATQLDRAADGISHAAAELILFGEDGRAAIAALARSIATELLSALIRVGIQALINKTLLASTSSGGGAANAGTGLLGLIGFAGGGYTGDDPRNKVTGVTHGQEFVVNAEATRENRSLLEQINNGTFNEGTDAPRASSQAGKFGMKQRIINVWDKSDIRDYLESSDGEEVFINWAGRNGSRLRSIIQTA